MTANIYGFNPPQRDIVKLKVKEKSYYHVLFTKDTITKTHKLTVKHTTRKL